MKLGQKKGEIAENKVFQMYERTLIELVANGFKHYEIAERVPPLSPELVETYMRQIKAKYKARNTPHLIHIMHTNEML